MADGIQPCAKPIHDLHVYNVLAYLPDDLRSITRPADTYHVATRVSASTSNANMLTSGAKRRGCFAGNHRLPHNNSIPAVKKGLIDNGVAYLRK
jgi:hypothetical protein